MLSIYNFALKWKLGLGLGVLGGLLMTPDMGMASGYLESGNKSVQGDPGEALGLRNPIFLLDPRDGLDEAKKTNYREQEGELDFLAGDVEDGLDLWWIQVNWSDPIINHDFTLYYGNFLTP